MGYSFMRFEKIKSLKGLSQAYKHNYRTMDVPNADKNLQNENEELVSLNGKTYEEAFKEKISSLEYYQNHNIRKNAVYALEVVTSFSREDLAIVDVDQWKKDNVHWLRATFNADMENYGDNVVSVMYHGDEAGNVHCHTLVIPIDKNGKLNADYYIGGKQKLIELQDSYGKVMDMNHTLKRGLRSVRAKHEDIKHFYAEINSSFYEKDKLPPIEKEETLDTYRKKIESYVKDLKGSHLREIKKMERENLKADHKADMKNQQLKEEVTELKKQVRHYEKERNELEREFGSMKLIKQKLDATESLNYALNNYIDDDYTKQMIEENNRMILWGKKQREKQKKRTKEKSM